MIFSSAALLPFIIFSSVLLRLNRLVSLPSAFMWLKGGHEKELSALSGLFRHVQRTKIELPLRNEPNMRHHLILDLLGIKSQ